MTSKRDLLVYQTAVEDLQKELTELVERKRQRTQSFWNNGLTFEAIKKLINCLYPEKRQLSLCGRAVSPKLTETEKEYPITLELNCFDKDYINPIEAQIICLQELLDGKFVQTFDDGLYFQYKIERDTKGRPILNERIRRGDSNQWGEWKEGYDRNKYSCHLGDAWSATIYEQLPPDYCKECRQVLGDKATTHYFTPRMASPEPEKE